MDPSAAASDEDAGEISPEEVAEVTETKAQRRKRRKAEKDAPIPLVEVAKPEKSVRG